LFLVRFQQSNSDLDGAAGRRQVAGNQQDGLMLAPLPEDVVHAARRWLRWHQQTTTGAGYVSSHQESAASRRDR